jgi:hypothetical protein
MAIVPLPSYLKTRRLTAEAPAVPANGVQNAPSAHAIDEKFHVVNFSGSHGCATNEGVKFNFVRSLGRHRQSRNGGTSRRGRRFASIESGSSPETLPELKFQLARPDRRYPDLKPELRSVQHFGRRLLVHRQAYR